MKGRDEGEKQLFKKKNKERGYWLFRRDLKGSSWKLDVSPGGEWEVG